LSPMTVQASRRHAGIENGNIQNVEEKNMEQVSVTK
jgi:hypothetical protein